MIVHLTHLANVKGVPKYKIAHWISRQHGKFIVTRYNSDGETTTSLPCILCKKQLDRYKIRWRAYYDNCWIDSDSENIPESKLTSRQANILFCH